MTALRTRIVDSPVGRLALRASESAIVALDWVDADAAAGPATPLLDEAARQLQAYFSGELQDFDLPLAPDGTDHQKKVWREMSAIPYGEVRTYGALAAAIGSAARAVGTACGRNPIPVIIPCHRVIAAGGRPGGYSGRGGLATKSRLLALEGAPGHVPVQGDLLDGPAPAR